MGFLDVGTPLSWEDSEKYRERIKKFGLDQFLRVQEINESRRDEELYWGDEVEFAMVHLDSGNEEAKVAICAPEVLEKLEKQTEKTNTCPVHGNPDGGFAWHPEFGCHMIEAIPDPPYSSSIDSILSIEPNMRLRRAAIQAVLPENTYVSSAANFPTFGLKGFTSPDCDIDPNSSCSRSVFIPDEVINPHPRFPTLVRNIRTRRGAKPAILIPVFQDVNTANHPMWADALPKSEVDRFKLDHMSTDLNIINPVKDFIYMDCFAFGMGQNCIQCTTATNDINKARYLYDNWGVLAPLFLALTAATPIHRGLLADTDTRWSTLEQAVDCRTHEEESTGKIPKSRYSGFSTYIANHPALTSRFKELNDTDIPINKEAFDYLKIKGIDDILARHVAHLFIRDPVVIFGDRVDYREDSVEHFENIQSTNWNSVRFKPPPPGADKSAPGPIGWRVEFRTPEAQLTDFDNAACMAIVIVLGQMIVKHELDFYIPMSKNDENMERSWQRNAVLEQKFWFRKDVRKDAEDKSFAEMTLHEIFNGCASHGFVGLLPLCLNYLRGEVAEGRCSEEAFTLFQSYASLFGSRASGQIMTTASFIRRFVTSHPDYKNDSVVSSTIAYDLCVLYAGIGYGIWSSEDLHGMWIKMIPTTQLPPDVTLPSLSKNCTSFKLVSKDDMPGRLLVEHIDDASDDG